MAAETYLEQVIAEALRPEFAALELMKREIRGTLQIPDAPWEILGKTYEQLTDDELMLLFEIYHQEGEVAPCPICKWSKQRELTEWGREEKEVGRAA